MGCPSPWQARGMGGLHVDAMTDAAAVIERRRLSGCRARRAQRDLECHEAGGRLGRPGRYWLLETDGDIAGIVIESPPGHAAAISPMSREHAARDGRGDLRRGPPPLGCLRRGIHGIGFRGLPGPSESNDGRGCARTHNACTRSAASSSRRVCRAARRAELAERSCDRMVVGLPGRDRLAWRRCVLGCRLGTLGRSPLLLGRRRGPMHRSCHSTARWHLQDRSCLHAAAVAPPTATRRRASGRFASGSANEEGANSVLYAQLANPSSNAIYRGSASKRFPRCSCTSSTTSSTANETSLSLRTVRDLVSGAVRHGRRGPSRLRSSSS